jgi:hypothetical protein
MRRKMPASPQHNGVSDLVWHQRLRVRLAVCRPMRLLLGRAWLFMDRDTEADDNAEHLYRHVLRRHPEIPAWFVLRPDSPDWPRLKADGFRLVPYGSLRHRLLLLNCERLVASGFAGAVFYLPPRLCRFTFACLGHGVTRGDNAEHSNRRPVAFWPMTTRQEWTMSRQPIRLSPSPPRRPASPACRVSTPCTA